MKPSTQAIAQAAIDSAFEILKAHGLESETASLIRELQNELSTRKGTLNVVLITPTGNAGDFAAKVQSFLEQKLNRHIDLREEADATLVGGAILQYGDSRIDLSVRGALEKARMHLEQTSN